jgi:hypothetical protein
MGFDFSKQIDTTVTNPTTNNTTVTNITTNNITTNNTTNNYNYGNHRNQKASLHNERGNSAINKKKYLQSAILNFSHTPVRSNDVRQVFEQNRWEFREDDFNDIRNNLCSIYNPKQRLAVIKVVRNCLQENINLKRENNHSDVNAFLDFSKVINDLFQQTKEEIDRQKYNDKPFYYNKEKEIYRQKHNEKPFYYNEEEQIALLNSFNNFSSTRWHQ